MTQVQTVTINGRVYSTTDYDGIEREARIMRAEMLRTFFAGVAKWVRGLSIPALVKTPA